jgi:S1/P1 nuclease
MRSGRTLAAVVLLCLYSVPSLALAWSGDGHQIVCLIAEDRLTPVAKAGIRELLGDDAEIADAEICLWADNVRRQRRETAPWHYVNVPTSQPSYDPQRDGNDGKKSLTRSAGLRSCSPTRPRPRRPESRRSSSSSTSSATSTSRCTASIATAIAAVTVSLCSSWSGRRR